MLAGKTFRASSIGHANDRRTGRKWFLPIGFCLSVGSNILEREHWDTVMSDQNPDAGKSDEFDVAHRLTRLAQIPMLIGLSVGMVLFLITFFVDIYDAVATYEFLDRKKTILLILNLLDMVFIANLVVMVANNTYNTFRLKSSAHGEGFIKESERAYRRMKHRIVSTIVIISSIHVLSELLEFSQVNALQVAALFGFHLILLATYVVTNVFRTSD
ncbi:putative membrane protein [Roseibium album]|uniref:Putative membrane protein n=2 Tax=Roseibium album TaxID=311410 RepID=A0A0M6ZQV8_9HYPH|nr:putative membrane protein [Roseibium album]CTQ64566.1 putative membrane protein [Roseibium album]CTQ72848.1 putative membrane protein [Roseibium album]